jgi:guanylate kinase
VTANYSALRRGLMMILSSPSGAGKSTLTRLLVQDDPAFRLSVSVTTRPRRPSEVDGVHYRFIDVDEFHFMKERGDLLEWAEVHGNFYGTPIRPVERAVEAGQDVLFDIDWQGTQQIVERMREDAVTVFILPPSFAELRLRLERRAEDQADTIKQRLHNARSEIARWTEYDYILINDDLQRTYADLRAIVAAERCARKRAVGLPKFVDHLIRGE